MIHCCVQGCLNNTKNNRNVSWHYFTANRKLQKIWIRNLSRNKKTFVPNKNSRICGVHFNKTGVKGEADRIPRYSLGTNMIRKLKRITPDTKCMQPLTTSKPQNINFLDDHNYFISKQTVINLQDTIAYLGPLYLELKEQVKALRQLIALKDKHISKLTGRSLVQNAIVEHNAVRLRWVRFAANPEAFRFFTGFDNSQQFLRLLQYLKPGYSAKRAVKFFTTTHFQTVLPISDQLFLVLCRLKLGYNNRDIAKSFIISNAAYDRIWEFWLNLMYDQLSRIPIWPKKKPTKSRSIILDCTKVCDIGKCLLGVSLDGVLTFFSDLYPIEMSDDKITQKCGILKLLHRGDRIFADRGFSIEHLAYKKGADLTRAFDSEDRFLNEEVIKTRSVVERVVKNLKDYKILVTTTNLWTLKVWKICCYLIKFKRDDFIARKIL